MITSMATMRKIQEVLSCQVRPVPEAVPVCQPTDLTSSSSPPLPPTHWHDDEEEEDGEPDINRDSPTWYVTPTDFSDGGVSGMYASNGEDTVW